MNRLFRRGCAIALIWMTLPLYAQGPVSSQELRGRVLDRPGDLGFEGALVRDRRTGRPAFDRYADGHLQLDFIGSCRFDSAYQLCFNAVNLNDEPFYAYFQDRGFASQREEYDPT